MWKVETEGRGRRAVIVAATSPEGTQYVAGDIVKLDSKFGEYGIIAGFRQEPTSSGGSLALFDQVRVLLLHDPQQIDATPEAPGEIFATAVLRWLPLEQVAGKIELGAPGSGKPFIRRAVDSRLRITGPVEVVPERDEVESIAAHVASVFRAEFATPRGRKPKVPRFNMVPKTLFPQPKPSAGTQNIGSNNRGLAFESGLDSDLESDESDTEGSDQSKSSSEGDDSDDVMEVSEESDDQDEDKSDADELDSDASFEVADTPSKKRRAAPARNLPRTPTKRQRGRAAAPLTPAVTPRKALKRRKGGSRRRSLDSDDEDAAEGTKSLPSTPQKIKRPNTPTWLARDKLHVSAVPDSLPCRGTEFAQVFVALQDAVAAQTGTCIYVSGTPGTGKTATVMEAVSQLQVRQDDGELPKFTFLEINGMRLPHPSTAYEILWAEISGQKQGQVSATTAMSSIEAEFQKRDTKRHPVVVLLDELDQMATRTQSVLYNFFNWPSLPHSKLVVVAVANTMDLPERMLSHKISSRLGLTRVSFRGYSFSELREIIMSRLEGLEVVDADAVEYIARKVAGVSGDARRALDICRRALEISGDNSTNSVGIELVREAIAETQAPPLQEYLTSLAPATKVILCAILARVRRTSSTEMTLPETLRQAVQLVNLAAPKLGEELLSESKTRLLGFQTAMSELGDAGVIAQQAGHGETTRKIRLLLAPSTATRCLENDPELVGLL